MSSTSFGRASSPSPLFLLSTVVVILCLFVSPSDAFGAGNIASIAKIEGQNFRHGDIEVCNHPTPYTEQLTKVVRFIYRTR